MSKDSHPTCRRGQDPGVLSRNLRIVPVLLEEKVGVSRATRVNCLLDHAKRNHTDNKHFQANAADGQDCDVFLIPDAEEVVCIASALRFYLTQCALSRYTERDLFLVPRCCIGTDVMRQRSVCASPSSPGS